MHRDVTDFEPAAVVVDPMSALLGAGVTGDVHAMVLRLVDFLKANRVTALFTNLGVVSGESAATEIQISSLMQTWLLLYNRQSNGEHNRQLYLLKSRGMAHSNQVSEFLMSSDGIKLRAAYLGPEGVLTGSARLARESKDKAAILSREQEIERRRRELERKRREIAAQIEILQARLVNDESEVARPWRREPADRAARAAGGGFGGGRGSRARASRRPALLTAPRRGRCGSAR